MGSSTIKASIIAVLSALKVLAVKTSNQASIKRAVPSIEEVKAVQSECLMANIAVIANNRHSNMSKPTQAMSQ